VRRIYYYLHRMKLLRFAIHERLWMIV